MNTSKILPAPVVPAATKVAIGYGDRPGTLIGFWSDEGLSDADIAKAGAPALTHPREHCDSSMPMAERDRIAARLDAAPIVARYRGSSHDRIDPSIRIGNAERAEAGYRWPSGLSHYVRTYGLRLDPDFLAALGIVEVEEIEELEEAVEHNVRPLTKPVFADFYDLPNEGPDHKAVGIVAYWSALGRDADANFLPERFLRLGEVDYADGWSHIVMLRSLYLQASEVTRAVIDSLSIDPTIRGILVGEIQ